MRTGLNDAEIHNPVGRLISMAVWFEYEDAYDRLMERTLARRIYRISGVSIAGQRALRAKKGRRAVLDLLLTKRAA